MATRRKLVCMLLCLLLLGPLGPRPRQVFAADSENEIGSFVAGAMIFIFFHELGHGLISLLDLPTVGPEEDVVDEFATMLLIDAAKEEDNPEDREAAVQTLLIAAQSWQLMWKSMQRRLREDPDALPWWDEHPVDIKRYYNIVCLLYGSDPGRFWPLVVKSGIPLPRARKCEREYATKSEHWKRLLEPFLRKEGAPLPEGEHGRFVVVYHDAKNEISRAMAQEFRTNRVWETFADNLNQTLILPPGRFEIQLRECGVANAFWNSADRTISLCYEMFVFLAALYQKEGQTELAAEQKEGAPPPGPAPPEKPAPAPTANGPFGPLAAVLGSGETPPWSRRYDGRSFVLRNMKDRSSLYRVAVSTPGIEGRRVVTTDLVLEPAGEESAAGLLFAGDERRKFLLLLVPGEGVSVFRFENSRLKLLQAWPSSVRAGVRHRLTLVEQGQEIAVALDKQQLGNLRNAAFGRGEVGITAFGTGTFTFLSFNATALTVPGTGQQPGPVAQQQPAPGQPGPVTQPQTPGTPSPQPQRDPRFVGTWTAYLQGRQGERTVIQLQLYADGRYLETRWLPDRTTARVWGGWSMVGNMLDFVPQGWDPWQRCDARGCVPLQPPPRTRQPASWLGRDSFQLGNLLFYRAR